MQHKLQPQFDLAIASTVAMEAQDIAQISADYQQASGYRKNVLLASMSDRIDALLDFFLHTFPYDVSPSETRDLFATHHPLTENGLGRLSPSAIPLVVIRELISVHGVIIDRDVLKNWTEFSRRYNQAVN